MTKKNKWTEQYTMEMGSEIISWLNKDTKNRFYQNFLVYGNKYNIRYFHIDLLRKKYKSFDNLMNESDKLQKNNIDKHGDCCRYISEELLAMNNVTLDNNNKNKPIKIHINNQTIESVISKKINQISYWYIHGPWGGPPGPIKIKWDGNYWHDLGYAPWGNEND